jgi:hypothetical protein
MAYHPLCSIFHLHGGFGFIGDISLLRSYGMTLSKGADLVKDKKSNLENLTIKIHQFALEMLD